MLAGWSRTREREAAARVRLKVSRLPKGSRANMIALACIISIEFTDIYVPSTSPILLNNLSGTNINCQYKDN